MDEDLSTVYTLTEQHLLSIQQFFLSRSDDFNENDAQKCIADDYQDANADKMDENNARIKAGIADWTDFDSFHNNSDDLIPPFIKKEDQEVLVIAKNSTWLQGSLISAVGIMDLLVFAHAQKIIVVEKNQTDNTFRTVGQFNVTDDSSWKPLTYIRCLCVLPMSCTRKTETCLYDWCVIIVGLSNGYVRFFTERGLLLRSEHVANSPIEEIRFGESVMAGNQELAILSQTDLTCIEGLSLYVALKAAKNQLARGETNVQKIAESSQLNSTKLKLESDVKVVDFGVSGPVKATWFDLSIAATLSSKGYEARVERSSLPLYSTYVFVGQSPYVGFGWYASTGSQNILSDTLYALGSQLTSSVVSSIPLLGISSLFGLNVSRKDRAVNSPIVELSSSADIPMRSVIIDGRRKGERIYMAPPKYKLAAITDSLARVVLLDIKHRLMLRIWKGYRDARCAWLEGLSTLDRKKNKYELQVQPSTVLYLVIFAPRRGLLEAWSMQNGKRVFASQVDRDGRLIGVQRLSDQLLGFDDRATSYLPSVFFLSSNGKIQRLLIPFHRALSDENGSAVHDSSIIREINHMTRKGKSGDLLMWFKFFRALRTAAAMKESICILWRSFDIDCFKFRPILTSILQHVERYDTLNKSMDRDGFLIYVSAVSQLLDAFITLHKIKSDPAYETDTEIEENNLSHEFFIDKETMDLCTTHIYEFNGSSTLDEKPELSFTEYLSNFDLNQSKISASNRNLVTNKLLRKTPTFGKLVFSGILTKRCTVHNFVNQILPKLGLSGEEIAELFCTYWLSSRHDCCYSLSHVLTLCAHLSKFDSSVQLCYEVNSALSLCLVARALSFDLQYSYTESNIGSQDRSDPEDWDHIELKLEWWDLLLRHLMCMNALGKLSSKLRVRVLDLINNGPAYYREQVGKWSAEFITEPEHFYDIFKDSASINPNVEWQIIISDLKKFFPISFSSELVMCDCAWECTSEWRRSKDKNQAYELLEKAVKFIELTSQAGRLQHGLCTLLWETFLCQPFRYIYDFLNRKSSQYKKLEDCRINIKRFSLCCSKILEMLRKSVRFAEDMSLEIRDSSSSVIKNKLFEDFIEAIFEFQQRKQAKPKKPLCDLAVQKKPVNFPLVCHHHDLAMVIQLQASLEEWPPGPKYFFDAVGERAFFESLYTHPLIPLESISESLREKRMEFLKKCVESNGSPEFTRYLRFLIYDLADDWKLNVDEIKAKEVINLFKKGLDSEAKDILRVIESMELLPYELFNVAVARVRKWFDTSDDDLIMRGLKMSAIDNCMIKYVHESKMEVVIVPPSDIEGLMQQVIMCLDRVQSTDQAVQTYHLAKKFEKLVALIK
ncbi:unnamed protein product [Thelazia callipaeda]|uniref:RAB3GAP2_N domain-containing protein n=1 Tax=Thelazia callipaeda TaxID=103827 RepID=A0A158RBB8_THECL|nr:unnamed protein product [Thelazia callipaeda]